MALVLGTSAAARAVCTCGYQDGRYTLATITLDGSMADWNSVLADPDNNACDLTAGAGDRDGWPTSGRDLVQFATTWNSTFLYGYTARAGSTSNQISFGYYADTNNNGLMETGEPVVIIVWHGSNRQVDVDTARYVAVNGGGDPLVDGSGYADGFTMPGGVNNRVSRRSGAWGAVDGLSMEWAVSWAELGVPAGSAIRWHIAVNNGSFNPGSPEDNMGGCGNCAGSNQFAALSFSPDNTINASRNTTVYLPHTITNQGSAADRFDLTSVSGGTFAPVSISYYKDLGTIGVYDPGVDVLLTDTNSNGIPDTGAMALGASMRILVAMVLPSRPGTATVTTSATSNVGYLCYPSQPAIKASVVDTVTILPDVAGFAYLDANHNQQRDGTETGSGLTLYVKLVPAASSSASQVATVDPATGGYTLPRVAAGNYTLVLDTNNNTADITPGLPFGWIGTETPTLQRSITVNNTDVTLQNYGLYHGSRISGVVFDDVGTSGGTPNDGIRQANEGPLVNALVRAKDSSSPTVYDSASTDSTGAYELYLPHTAAGVDVIETNLPGYISTGGSAGTTGGVYVRLIDTTSFTATAGTAYSGVNFADVPDNALAPDGAQSGLPGTVILYPHTFTASTAGSVTLSLSAIASGGGSGPFTENLYRDTNCNGAIDSGEPKIFGAINLATGEKLCVVVQEFIPAGAPFNTENKIALTAQYSFLNALPSLNASYTRTDLTTVGTPSNAALKLVKSVDKATALPGDTLVYTITFTNNSSGPLSNIVINDSTPAYTRYVSAGCGAPLPADLTACTVSTQPPVNGTGAIKWTLTGSVASGGTGTLTYSVKVQ